jgi:hypothetical protein
MPADYAQLFMSLCFSTQQSAVTIQPTKQFGAVWTGILPGNVAKNEGSREPARHRFHRIEQSVTFFEVGGMVLKPKRPTLAKTPQSGAPSSFVTLAPSVP